MASSTNPPRSEGDGDASDTQSGSDYWDWEWSLITSSGPKAIISLAEFVLLFAAISIAARLADSLWLLLLKNAVLAAFCGLVFGKMMPGDMKAPWPLFVLAAVGAVGSGVAGMMMANAATEAALIQLDPKAMEQVEARRRIRRETHARLLKAGCAPEVLDMRPCSTLLAEGEQREKAARVEGGR